MRSASAGAKIDTSSGPQQLEISKLMWIELPAAASQKVTIWIDLLDGSRLHAVSYTVSDGKARIGLATGQTVELPTRSIHTVRFHQQTPELATQWREITSSMATGDMVIIRKTSMRTIEQGENEPRTVTEQALDLHEGTLLDVAESIVACALRREESRGAHQRTDFPARDDRRFLAHSLLYRNPDGSCRVEYLPVTITRWPPAERVYGKG